SVEEAGQHELTFDFSEEFKDWNISLRDLKTGAQISINEENSFSFSSAEVQDENRFNLILEPENVLAINDLNGLDIQYFKDRILLTNFGTEKTSFKLQIMDLTGRKIFAHEEQNSGNQSTIDFNFSPNQIYVIHVATDYGQIIQKIVFH
ncbi:MAG: T9SS type A sorting domain-containing protein, partial [Marinoscillum sp.]